MLPLEKFVQIVFYENWFCGFDYNGKKIIEKAIEDCNLKCRKGKSFKDVRLSIGKTFRHILKV